MIEDYTPTQKAFLRVLSDGLPHAVEELIDVLPDPEMSTKEHVWKHLTLLRSKLREKGEEVICENLYRRNFYRHIRLLKPLEKGA